MDNLESEEINTSIRLDNLKYVRNIKACNVRIENSCYNSLLDPDAHFFAFVQFAPQSFWIFNYKLGPIYVIKHNNWSERIYIS